MMNRIIAAALIAVSAVFAGAPAFAQQAYKFGAPDRAIFQERIDAANALLKIIHEAQRDYALKTCMSIAAMQLDLDPKVIVPLLNNGTSEQQQAFCDYAQRNIALQAMFYEALLGQKSE